MRRFEIDADAGPHRRIPGVDPFVPGAIHLALPLHVGDVDDGREDLALVRAAQRKALTHLIKGLFDGSPGLLVLNVLDDQQLDVTELQRLRQMIDESATEK